MMKFFAACAATLIAGSASAVTVQTTPMGTAPSMPAGHQAIGWNYASAMSLNSGLDGFSWARGIQTATASVHGAHAAPAGVTGGYAFITNNGRPKPLGADLILPNAVQELSFYWGSIDSFNSFNIWMRDAQGNVRLSTIVRGSDPGPLEGSWTSPEANRLVTITAGPGETIARVSFRTGGIAFEMANFSYRAGPASPSLTPNLAAAGMSLPGDGSSKLPLPGFSPGEPVAALPEPATWAMMILGFGAVGLSLRRRRAAATRVTA